MARPLTSRLLPTSPWWTASPWSSAPASCRAVTDISYYKETDSSHLHLLEAQSTLRKFKIKLKEREAEKERLRKLRESKKLEGVAATPRASYTDAYAEPVRVPTYIERRPGEIMRVIASHVGTDYTAPDYIFHDDPMLIPRDVGLKRDWAHAKIGGKLAAQYIFKKHPELFSENKIEMEPKIMKFMPRAARFTKEGSNEELLKVYLEGEDVVMATKCYEAMEEREKPVSNETKEALLQMLAFHNHAQPLSEEGNVLRKFSKEDEPSWESGCLAEKIYSSMDPVTPGAKVALLCGYTKFGRLNDAFRLMEECRADGIKLPVVARNLFIAQATLSGDWERTWGGIERQLKFMVADGCRPDARTIGAIMRTIQRATPRFGPSVTGGKALEVMAEARRCGIRPGLTAFKHLANIFGHQSDIIFDILSEVENEDWSTITEEEDVYFLRHAMETAAKRDDMDLAYRVHKMALKDCNRVLLDDFRSRQPYFSAFFKMVLKHEPVDVALETVDRFTPNFTELNNDIREAMLQKVKDEGGYQYLHQLWATFTEQRFGGRQEFKFRLISRFLDIIRHADLAELGMEDLAPSYAQICRECMGLLEAYSDEDSQVGRSLAKNYPLSSNTVAVEICDNIINFCLRHGEIKTARGAMTFCCDNVAALVGFLKDDTIREFAGAMIEANEKAAAVECIIYAFQQSLDSADAIAAEVAENLELSEEQKSKLNQMFAHESRWKMLA